MSPAGSSTGRSANRSNSAAVIMGDSVALRLCVKVLRFLAVARAADRDEADRFFMAICHRGSPQGLRDLTNQEKARLVRRPSRELDAIRIQPQRLRLDEINAVFRCLRLTSRHPTRTASGIETIPPHTTIPSQSQL